MSAASVMVLRGVRKTYRLGEHVVPALQGVDLDVQAGELLALTGPSGSGKSTLLNLCGLIDSPDEGQVLLDGRPVDARQALAATLLRRDAIGFVFQSFNLVPVMTVAENVDYPLFLAGVPAAERRRRVDEALVQVGLSAHAAHRPDALSGGQRQRVAMARALVKRPRLVIADEPTASLDSHTAEQVLGLMRRLAHEGGAAFLIATHDERLTRRCDRVIGLLDGRIVRAAAPGDDTSRHLPASTASAQEAHA
ncbi:ABC transporter ATP-binding protein [Pelomonas sp. APW6]|uniref:ABC transporter ATP-binding protein n=1 Tax=Roseateles subflavus TaxID=3053353 RepID=A0ABT7LN66_9BURK|nr:ABC transporter ATP-binding protein [Pelomonas sp. APW6]MDL5032936.1 ABC transporter ATP-binding protein [Pelomonas sp. APW6]